MPSSEFTLLVPGDFGLGSELSLHRSFDISMNVGKEGEESVSLYLKPTIGGTETGFCEACMQSKGELFCQGRKVAAVWSRWRHEGKRVVFNHRLANIYRRRDRLSTVAVWTTFEMAGPARNGFAKVNTMHSLQEHRPSLNTEARNACPYTM
jgi:hypothetical protein